MNKVTSRSPWKINCCNCQARQMKWFVSWTALHHSPREINNTTTETILHYKLRRPPDIRNNSENKQKHTKRKKNKFLSIWSYPALQENPRNINSLSQTLLESMEKFPLPSIVSNFGLYWIFCSPRFVSFLSTHFENTCPRPTNYTS